MQGLEDLPWEKTRGCEGSAAKVPKLFVELEKATTKSKKEKLLFEIRDIVWHQGRLYEAALPVVPFLVRFLGTDEKNERFQLDLILTLSALAQGQRPFFGATDADDALIHQCFQAVRSFGDQYQSLLGTKSSVVRAFLIYLIGVCKLEDAGDRLMELLPQESQPNVLAMTFFALSQINRKQAKTKEIEELSSKHLIVRSYASVYLANTNLDEAPMADVCAHLVRAITDSDYDPYLYPHVMLTGEEYCRQALKRVYEANPDLVVAELLDQASIQPSPHPGELLKFLLDLLIPRKPGEPWNPFPQYQSLSQFTPNQKKTLATIASCDRLWNGQGETSGSMDDLLRKFHLPRTRELLGLTARE